MRAIAIFAILSAVAPCLSADDPPRAMYRADMADEIDAMIARGISGWIDYYKDLHAHPELSEHERESARKIADHLTRAGYSVTSGIGGHGLVGVLVNGKGPTVLIRGDMDALPVMEETGLPYASEVRVPRPDGSTVGVMHACGHDIHQTCLVGTAQLLAAMRDRWRGTALILAQPAEEIGKGARLMIESGIFDRINRPDFCLALHVSAGDPAGTVAYTPGWALANVDSVDIRIFGRGGHGSRPHETVDPVVAAAQIIVSLQTIVSRRVDPLESAVITVGSIHAGSKHNIISDEAVLQLTVRSYSDETRRVLLDGIRDVTLHTCRAMGCEKDPIVYVREDEFTPSTYNDLELAAAAAEVFRQAIGAERVRVRAPVMGGEDFGRYPRHLGVPGLIFWLGSVSSATYEASLEPGADPLPSLHSNKFAPDPKPTIETGVKCMTSLALALFDTVE
ncbi:MAG: amidohydrolase [Planctomycetes bacterium]|nr:amidohydrolase [Planctomycetota bacterium]